MLGEGRPRHEGSSVFGGPVEWSARADSNRPQRQCRRVVVNPEVNRLFPRAPSLERKFDEGDYRCLQPALERFQIRMKAKLEGWSSGATRSASCLLAGHLFLHLLLHFLRCV